MNDVLDGITRRTLLVGTAATATALSWQSVAYGAAPRAASTGPIDALSKLAATINTQSFRPTISPKLYGGFIEHIGNLINHSLWSEMLDDRKFFHGVIEKPETKPSHPLAALSFNQKWLAVGPISAIELDKEKVWVGQHSPVIIAMGDQPVGMAQRKIALKASAQYIGRIVVWAESGVKLKIKLSWGEGPEQSLEQKVATTKKWQTRTFKFKPGVNTTEARFEILASGEGRCGIGAVSLMPADNIKGFRADTLALMKEMNCPILRMPGGNFVSSYDWKHTIGEADLRPPIYDPVWKAVQPNDVGVDELLQLCELIGSEPFWCASTGFAEPRSGAELVEYINGSPETTWGKVRALNGRKNPYGVKYWAVGNEMYGHWQMGHMSPEQYAIKHNLFADAMRAVDPSIYIVAPGGFVDEMTTGQGIFIAGQPEVKVGSERDWAYSMFKGSWGKFDALGTHAYPPQDKRFDLKTGKLFDVKMPLNEWARQPANRVRTMVDAWEEYKKHFPKLTEGTVKVFFDEWAYGFEDSLKNCLAIALTLHEFFRHTDFIAMAGFTMATAWLDFNRTDATISAKGRIFQMYHQHFGAIPVAVAGNNPPPKPVYPIGGDQPSVNTGSPQWPLDVSASLSEDRRALIVAVVNATEQAQQLELDIQGFAPAAKGRCWKFTGTSLNARNAVGKPPEVTSREMEFDAGTKQLLIAATSVEFYRFELA
jgi:alpha-N-arabinofuranosidase